MRTPGGDDATGVTAETGTFSQLMSLTQEAGRQNGHFSGQLTSIGRIAALDRLNLGSRIKEFGALFELNGGRVGLVTDEPSV